MGRILVNMKYIKLFEDWTAENPDLERVRQFNGSIKDMHTWLSRKLKEQGLEGETNPYKHTIMVNGPHMDDKDNSMPYHIHDELHEEERE